MKPSIHHPDPFNPENSLKRILITGGCGFIGINLIAYLLKENPDAKIKVLDNLSVGTRDDLSEVCNFVELNPSILTSESSSSVGLMVADIRDFNSCLEACRGSEVVIHLAANTGVAPSVENPRKDLEANVIGTFNMLEASRRNGVKKFIFASSGAPLGEVEPPIHEKKAPKPVSPYGASKLAGEGYCSAYYRTFGLKTVSLRFGNVYGPRSKHKSSVVAKFFKQALNGDTLEIYGDGGHTRDFIYIDDLIQVISLILTPSIPNPEPWGEIFQIATSRETTINEVAVEIKKLVENETGKEVVVIYGNPRRGDVRRNYSNISKAKEILGWEPEFNLETGLRYSFEYFKNHTLVSKTAKEGI